MKEVGEIIYNSPEFELLEKTIEKIKLKPHKTSKQQRLQAD
jgi:hypothetical protein